MKHRLKTTERQRARVAASQKADRAGSRESIGYAHPATGLVVLSLLAAPLAGQACATCGCSLSSDAAMGYSASSGWRINLQYDFINQNQLRSGYNAIPPAQVATINSGGGDQEIEKGTINRYLTAGITYSPTADWSVTAQVPYINRTHTTYGNATPDQLTPDNVSYAHSVGLGDIKLIGAYQGFLPLHNFGVQLGVKLPTGHYGGANVATGATVGHDPAHFSTGPSAGEVLDTSLSPDTGSYDVIVGAYYYQAISQNFDAFINGQYQATVAHHLNQPGADFRPGNQENLSFGLRYEFDPRWVPQLQVNVTHKSPDQGALADNTGTAGTVIYFSPGITVRVIPQVHAYAFVQRAVFSHLDGYQVFPHWTGSLGVSYAF